MKNAIVGAPQSGKSTIFDLLTGGTVPSSPGQNRIGVIKVPDERLEELSKLYPKGKVVHEEIVFIDFGAREAGSKRLFSLSAKDLDQLRACPTISITAGAFHLGLDAALNEIEDACSSFLLEDLVLAESRIESLRKEGKKGAEIETLKRVKDILENNRFLSTDISLSEDPSLVHYSFFTKKPLIALLNVSEEDLNATESSVFNDFCTEKGIYGLLLCAPLEAEIASLSPEDREPFLKEMGLEEPARDRFIKTVYRAMNYITFYTVGDDEVRAWKIKKGTNARAAAGRIHSDLEKGFIRAEVMSCSDLLSLGSEAAVKSSGKLRLEGKDYIVKDGDILHVRFNV